MGVLGWIRDAAGWVAFPGFMAWVGVSAVRARAEGWWR